MNGHSLIARPTHALACHIGFFRLFRFATSRVELTLDANLLPSKVASPQKRGDAADPATNGTAPRAFVSFALSDLMNQRRCGMSDPQQFASDNYSGICPEAWAAMAAANHGQAPAYGDDEWTARASDAFRVQFETPLRGVLRLQRHRGQFARAGLALPVLPQRHLYGVGACRDRRMRRAGVLLQRLEASGCALGGRQADAAGDPQPSPPIATTSTFQNRAW